ncbi:transmembrane protein 79 isoform X2 [Lepisosteus oculatus]|uniref:transmembrane protein 79 isoform X2 n=1 Tax=Lepisosteus oculatus TaxID=7918 RepID=UPI0037106555
MPGRMTANPESELLLDEGKDRPLENGSLSSVPLKPGLTGEGAQETEKKEEMEGEEEEGTRKGEGEEERGVKKEVGEEEVGVKEEQGEEEKEEEVRSALTESSTLLWSAEKREAEKGSGVLGATGAEMEEDPLVNSLPEKAAQVFSPSVRILGPRSGLHRKSADREELCVHGGDPEKSPFLNRQGTPPDGYWPEDDGPSHARGRCCGCRGRDALKSLSSLVAAALIFPLLLWGGFVFLPFDAPLLPGAPLRLVYTLRCAAFATVPVVLGVLVLGLSRLCWASLMPQSQERGEVWVHRHFVQDSLSLFLLFFLNLAVLSTYLSQETLKLVPLLTGLFAIARLVYWLAFALGSSFRGLGFGLTFFPVLVMLVANLYFTFVQEGGSIFALEEPEEPGATPPPGQPRLRFWG